MSGFFDWLAQSPGGASADANASPAPGFNTLGLIGAGLSDIAQKIRREPAGNVAAWQQNRFQLGLMQQQIAARQAYAKAMQSGDSRAILAARAQLIASGAVPANYAFPQMQRGYMVLPDGSGAQAVAGGPADPRVIAQRAAARKGQLPFVPLAATPAPGSEQGIRVYDENGEPLP